MDRYKVVYRINRKASRKLLKDLEQSGFEVSSTRERSTIGDKNRRCVLGILEKQMLIGGQISLYLSIIIGRRKSL